MIHRVVRGIARFLFFLFVKLDVQGIEHVPEEGPALLVCNHVNLMDPVVPLGVFKRPVSFMANPCPNTSCSRTSPTKAPRSWLN